MKDPTRLAPLGRSRLAHELGVPGLRKAHRLGERRGLDRAVSAPPAGPTQRESVQALNMVRTDDAQPWDMRLGAKQLDLLATLEP